MKNRPFGIKQIDRFRLWILLSLLVVALISVFLSYLITSNLSDFLLNLGTELLGAGLSFMLIDWFVGNRLDREAHDQERAKHRQELRERLRSQDNRTALEALSAMRSRGWLIDGSLKGAYLANASLENAILHSARLPSANLDNARLAYAVMKSAELQGAFLFRANLQKADLSEANLEGAVLSGADMTSAILRRTDLRKANLLNTRLYGALFDNAVFDNETVLPDGSTWSDQTDLKKFTEANSGLAQT